MGSRGIGYKAPCFRALPLRAVHWLKRGKGKESKHTTGDALTLHQITMIYTLSRNEISLVTKVVKDTPNSLVDVVILIVG